MIFRYSLRTICLMLLLVFCHGALGQLYLGLNAGISLQPKSAFDVSRNNRDELEVPARPNFGVNLGYKWQQLGVEVGAVFFQGKLNNSRFSYVQFPLHIKGYLPEGIFCFAGPQLGILQHYQTRYDDGNARPTNETYGFRRYDPGASVGIGYDGPFGLSVMARYALAFRNISPRSSGPFKSTSFQFSLGYKVDVGGLFEETQPLIDLPGIGLGVRSGVSLRSAKSYGLESFANIKNLVGFHIGLQVTKPLSNHDEVQLEIQYDHQRLDDVSQFSNIFSAYTSQYLQFPLVYKYFLAQSWFLQGGIQPGVLLSHKRETNPESLQSTIPNQNLTDSLNRFDFALTYGLGYELRSGLFFSARHSPGITSSQGVRSSAFQVAMGYQFSTLNRLGRRNMIKSDSARWTLSLSGGPSFRSVKSFRFVGLENAYSPPGWHAGLAVNYRLLPYLMLSQGIAYAANEVIADIPRREVAHFEARHLQLPFTVLFYPTDGWYVFAGPQFTYILDNERNSSFSTTRYPFTAQSQTVHERSTWNIHFGFGHNFASDLSIGFRYIEDIASRDFANEDEASSMQLFISYRLGIR